MQRNELLYIENTKMWKIYKCFVDYVIGTTASIEMLIILIWCLRGMHYYGHKKC